RGELEIVNRLEGRDLQNEVVDRQLAGLLGLLIAAPLKQRKTEHGDYHESRECQALRHCLSLALSSYWSSRSPSSCRCHYNTNREESQLTGTSRDQFRRETLLRHFRLPFRRLLRVRALPIGQ